MVGINQGSDNSALAQKIRELLKKKENRHNELRKIEEVIKKEDEEIRKELEETVREIREEEEEKFKESHKEEPESVPLESTVEELMPEKAPETENAFGYSSIDSSALHDKNIGVYDIAKQDVYNKVKSIIDTPENFRTSEERNFLKGITYHIDRLQREDMYISKKDPDEFIKRTSTMISSFYK